LESKFVNLGRKKAIWKTASDLGIEDWSLSTFYKHFDSKDKYIYQLINWDRVKSIASALEIDDNIFDELYLDAAIHIKEFDDERAAANYLHFKGR
jgi:hypothetical protein